MTMRVAAIGFGAALISGCSTNNLNFRPTMGADQAAIGIEASALLNELQKAYLSGSSDCLITATPSIQNAESDPFRRMKNAGESDSQTASRLGCITFRTGSPTEYKRHLDAGFALADLYCDDYFRRIAKHKQLRQFGRSTTNDVGTAASAALGIASAGSIATGAAGTLFGLLDGVYRNYDTAFVVEPDLGKMLSLVKTAQASMRGSYSTSTPTSYPDANAAIVSYAQLCSYAGMDNLLNVALEAGSTPETIDEAVTRFQTSASRLELTKERRKAQDLEAKLKAIEDQQEAQRKIDDLQSE